MDTRKRKLAEITMERSIASWRPKISVHRVRIPAAPIINRRYMNNFEYGDRVQKVGTRKIGTIEIVLYVCGIVVKWDDEKIPEVVPYTHLEHVN